MKQVIVSLVALLLVLLFVAGCAPTLEPEPANTSEPVVQAISKCDSYSEGPRKVLCYAMEAKDITMCADIDGRFREECVVVLAELVHDESLVSYCDISKVENNQKICRALISEDIEKCFDWGQGEGVDVSLSVRDCISLTSRKLRNPELCELFETRAQQIYSICGDTSDCEGQWIDGAADHASDCRYAVEEAMQND